MVSGRGNDSIAKAYEKLVGRDIVGMYNIYYLGVKPLIDEDGYIAGTIV